MENVDIVTWLLDYWLAWIFIVYLMYQSYLNWKDRKTLEDWHKLERDKWALSQQELTKSSNEALNNNTKALIELLTILKTKH